MRNRPSEEPWIRWAAAERFLRQIVGLADQLHHPRRAGVAILADQGVDLPVLAEGLDPGGQHDQLAAVGDRHPRAIDGLVAQPGAVELLGIEIDDHLPRGLVEHA